MEAVEGRVYAVNIGGTGGGSLGNFGGMGGTGGATSAGFPPDAPSGGGGGGAGLGGAIFIKDGATLTLAESVSFGTRSSENTAIAGTGGAPSAHSNGGS